MGLHISLAAEKVFDLFGLPISNSMLAGWIVTIFLILYALVVRTGLKPVPGTLQVIAESIVGGLYSLFETVVGEKVKRFFPLLATFFLFIIFANWIGLLPGVGTIGFKEVKDHGEVFTPLLRAGTADLNTTLALAIISVVAIQYFSIRSLGLGAYLHKFLNFSNPIYFFVGLLEMVSEFIKIISFAFRLFGNVFAGEVLLAVIAFLIPIFVPLPFLALEIFVGFIQALVFSMLSAVFLSVATQKAEH